MAKKKKRDTKSKMDVEGLLNTKKRTVIKGKVERVTEWKVRKEITAECPSVHHWETVQRHLLNMTSRAFPMMSPCQHNEKRWRGHTHTVETTTICYTCTDINKLSHTGEESYLLPFPISHALPKEYT